MKLCYFLQVLRGVPLGYRFTLYSYGPFDADVLWDLGTAEATRAVASEVVYYQGGYGYKITKAEHGDAALRRGADFLRAHRDELDWVLAEFGSHGSAQLELESTIIYADREAFGRGESVSIADLARRVRDVKPQFPESHIAGTAERLFEKDMLRCVQASAISA